ncbi:hypothetical protein CLF_112105 [Clonorchis sinensis]|uniref:Uncharacterized protein n=1 Tax=Clonorchis sinensis TaxID=79923 RepID=G7YVU7_CLOSI|nr:hypothetical protein CLF_112105 [Clonorchis sinensis]
MFFCVPYTLDTPKLSNGFQASVTVSDWEVPAGRPIDHHSKDVHYVVIDGAVLLTRKHVCLFRREISDQQSNNCPGLKTLSTNVSVQMHQGIARVDFIFNRTFVILYCVHGMWHNLNGLELPVGPGIYASFVKRNEQEDRFHKFQRDLENLVANIQLQKVWAPWQYPTPRTTMTFTAKNTFMPHRPSRRRPGRLIGCIQQGGDLDERSRQTGEVLERFSSPRFRMRTVALDVSVVTTSSNCNYHDVSRQSDANSME